MILINILNIWQQSVFTAWSDMLTRALLFLPVFLGAIIIFVIGFFIAGWLAQATAGILKTLRFSRLTSEAGLDKFLKKADINYDSVSLISAAVKWFIILVFFMASANILGLTAISLVLSGLLSFIPRIITATLIIALGVFVANVVDGLVRGALTTVDHSQAKSLGRLARGLVLVITILAGISELKIAQNIVNIFFQGLTWTITLAVGLAVGLGSKDLISQVLKDWYEKLKK